MSSREQGLDAVISPDKETRTPLRIDFNSVALWNIFLTSFYSFQAAQYIIPRCSLRLLSIKVYVKSAANS